MINERLVRALEWAKKKRIGSKQLNIFDRLYRNKQAKQKKQNKPVAIKGIG